MVSISHFALSITQKITAKQTRKGVNDKPDPKAPASRAFGQSKWRQSRDAHFETKRKTGVSLIIVISMGDSHVTVTIVSQNAEIILWGWIMYYYSPLGSSSKSHHFNGTFNIKQTLGTNIRFLTLFSAFWILSLNSTKTRFRKFVFK